MRLLSITSVLIISAYCCGATVINWENQADYDMRLEGHLQILRSFFPDTYPSCRNLYDIYPEGESLDFIYAKSTRLPWPYEYSVVSTNATSVMIKATNKMGGRSYIYDTEWFVAHYIFLTDTEAIEIGRNVICWLTDDDLSSQEEHQLLLALGWRGLYTQSEFKDSAKLDVLSCLGDFLVYEDLREMIWEAVQGGHIYKGDIGRAICARSILSKYEDYPDELKGEVLVNITQYTSKIDDGVLSALVGQIREFCSKRTKRITLPRGAESGCGAESSNP